MLGKVKEWTMTEEEEKVGVMKIARNICTLQRPLFRNRNITRANQSN
jgi:hypothetical protein